MTQVYKLNTSPYTEKLPKQQNISQDIIEKLFDYLNKDAQIDIQPSISLSLTINENYYVLDKQIMSQQKFNSVDIDLKNTEIEETEDVSDEDIYESIYEQLHCLNNEIVVLREQLNTSINRIDQMG